MHDPLEQIIADALDVAEMDYITDEGGGNPSNLDFRLHNGVEIEVKRFHTPRIADQMGRAENVIAAQGEQAVRFLAELISAKGNGVTISRELYSFLMGEGALEGVWFGDLNEGFKGTFWWRALLRCAAGWPDA